MQMNAFTLLWNAASNVFALPAIYACWQQKRYLGVAITTSSFLASCLMHITDRSDSEDG